MSETEQGVRRGLPALSGTVCCEQEEIFEFCEGTLQPVHARRVRDHLKQCANCRSLYEQEASLSAALSHPEADRGETSNPKRTSHARPMVSHRVAMALPTRSVIAKVVWGGGAAALLVMALISLSLHSVQPFTFITHFMGICWGLASGISDAADILMAVSGQTILVALVVGALVDALIVATLLVAARWRWPRGV